MIWIPALLVGSALILPLVYLAIRTFATGESDVLDLLFRERVAAILARTVILVVSVTDLCSWIRGSSGPGPKGHAAECP